MSYADKIKNTLNRRVLTVSLVVAAIATCILAGPVRKRLPRQTWSNTIRDARNYAQSIVVDKDVLKV